MSERRDKGRSETIGSRLKYSAPEDALPGWLPTGYRLVTDPKHVLRSDDALRHFLSSDWRLVGDVNGGARVGLTASDAGDDLLYLATRDSGQACPSEI